MLCMVRPGGVKLEIVVMKLIAPRIDAGPAGWSEKIAMATAGPGEPLVDSGAQTFQPVPAPRPLPPGTNIDPTSMTKATNVSQKETLFMRGNAMSGAPIINGTNQLPKPPIIAGMTMKKTMIRPCAVIITFQKCLACTSPAAASKNCAQPVRY